VLQSLRVAQDLMRQRPAAVFVHHDSWLATAGTASHRCAYMLGDSNTASSTWVGRAGQEGRARQGTPACPHPPTLDRLVMRVPHRVRVMKF
jgi:hypothetical protein